MDRACDPYTEGEIQYENFDRKTNRVYVLSPDYTTGRSFQLQSPCNNERPQNIIFFYVIIPSLCNLVHRHIISTVT